MTQDDFNSAFADVSARQLPPSADPRRFAWEVLRRDQQRARALAALSLFFWFLGVSGLLLLVYGLNRFVLFIRIADWAHPPANPAAPQWDSWVRQMDWGTSLIHHSMPFIAISIASLMLAGLFTVLLVLSSRQATFTRINISLMQLSEQVKTMHPPASAPPVYDPALEKNPPAPWKTPAWLLACLLMLLAAAIFIHSFLGFHSMWQGYPILSPFQSVRWNNQTPQVQVNGSWYELLTINDIPADQIVAFSASKDPASAHKHFEEDLVELLTLMGHPPGKTATLQVKDLSSAQQRILQNVPMTEENRWDLWSAGQNQ